MLEGPQSTMVKNRNGIRYHQRSVIFNCCSFTQLHGGMVKVC